MKTALALAVGAAAAALIAAPAAHASDDSFYSQLAELWKLPSDADVRADALAVGYGMCADMRSGVPRELTARSWHMLHRDNSTLDQANQIAYLAQSELCPTTAE
ncbi:hypothetical protein I5G81_gp44 [Mycobacterium phage Shandong1]|uniref:DUF732 domain-containing protein n=1 Tax=Mycobacterium phage Shandong1 TaxID=1983447 RepID=A0A1X9SH71_9CAUD|nr:hypothetical protein I5G81_gp44 [Mycobacterium phage Shandong1]ARQ95483.1 hypothetical protein [Mycobacterium phage Shandong1]